jgi:hypothetical protein
MAFPQNFNLERVMGVLQRNDGRLGHCFHWASSDEGYEFWRHRASNNKLDPEGRAALERYVQIYKQVHRDVTQQGG